MTPRWAGWVGGSRETWPSPTGWIQNGHFRSDVIMQTPLTRSRSEFVWHFRKTFGKNRLRGRP